MVNAIGPSIAARSIGVIVAASASAASLNWVARAPIAANRGAARCCAETIEDFESDLGRIDVGRRLPEHHGQFLAPGGGILEITLQLGNQRCGFFG